MTPSGKEKKVKTSSSTPTVRGSPSSAAAAEHGSSGTTTTTSAAASSPLPGTFKPFTFSPVGPFGGGGGGGVGKSPAATRTSSPLASFSVGNTLASTPTQTPTQKSKMMNNSNISGGGGGSPDASGGGKYEFKFSSASFSSPLASASSPTTSSSSGGNLLAAAAAANTAKASSPVPKTSTPASSSSSFEIDRLIHYANQQQADSTGSATANPEQQQRVPEVAADIQQQRQQHLGGSSSSNGDVASAATINALSTMTVPIEQELLLSGTTTPTATSTSAGWRQYATNGGSSASTSTSRLVTTPSVSRGSSFTIVGGGGQQTPSSSSRRSVAAASVSSPPLGISSPSRMIGGSGGASAGHGDLLAIHTAALNTLHETFTSLIHARETSASDLEREVLVWKAAYMRASDELVGLRAEVELLRLGREEAMAVGKLEGKREEEAKGKRGTFTAVLVDGDSNVFHEDLISEGAAGGRKAAKLLLSSLPGILARHAPSLPASALSQSQAIVNVFVNRNGLANTLYKANLVPSLSVVNDFWLGFSQSHANISVIDVGQGKEAVDAKIVAQLRLFSGLQQCGLTLLAASGDGGYANILRTLQTESPMDTIASPHIGNRVVLLRGPSFAFALEGICPVAEIDGLFMRDKIMFGMHGAGGSTPRFGHATPIKAGGGFGGSPFSQGSSAKKAAAASKAVATPSSTKKALKSMLAASSSSLSATPAKTPTAKKSSSTAKKTPISSRLVETTSDSAKEPEWTATDTDDVTEDSDVDVEDDVVVGGDSHNRQLARLATKAAKQLKQAKEEMASERAVANKKRARIVASSTEEESDSDDESPLDDGLGSDSDEDDDDARGWEDVPSDLVEGMKALSSKDTRDAESKRRKGQGAMDLATLGRVSASGRQRKKAVPGGELAVRKLNPRPCHKDYLNPISACDNSHCTFGHLYKLSVDQMNYLAKLVKQVPCPLLKIGRCPEEGVEGCCFYGHTCPHGRKCNWGDDCRFRELPGGGHAGM